MVLDELPAQLVSSVLQWVDLSSNLRWREANKFYCDEIPRRTTTLVARGCVSAKRCHDKIFAANVTLLRSVMLDFDHPRRLRPVTSGPDEVSAAGRVLAPLVRRHRLAELRIENMIHGGDFANVLIALEDNILSVRLDLGVLQLRLATGGPNPYQDPRLHHWCMLRLQLLLGGGQTPEGREVVRELTELTGTLDTGVDDLAGLGFAQRVASASGDGGNFSGKAYWPRLRDLRISCGIMGGDLEGLSACLGSNMPALSSLFLEGHSFRAPLTDLTAFAAALMRLPPMVPPRHSRLTTLSLTHFKFEGVAGVTAVGKALCAERFPCLSALSIDCCRLGDCQVRALAVALPAMSRTLRSLSLRGNYALSAVGISSLAEALRTGVTGPLPRQRQLAAFGGESERGYGSDGCVPCERQQGDGEEESGERRRGGVGSLPPTTNVNSNGFIKMASESSSLAASDSTVTIPTRAPAWSVPAPPPTAPGTSFSPSSPASTTLAALSPIMIESLDLSYSCWWWRPQTGCNSSTDMPPPPLTSLLRALGEGACPRLRRLNLEGCHFGDQVVEQLVVALETGCRGLRVLNVAGNHFGKEGVALIADALLSGNMPPHLRIELVRKSESHDMIMGYAGMSREDAMDLVEAWRAVQHLA